MLRTLDLVVDSTSWPNGVAPTALTSKIGPIQIDTSQALLATAIRTRHPRATGLQLADFWAWLRYFPAIDNTPDLRLKPAWKDIDPHQKTILSDDWGMGFSTFVVGDLLSVALWGNTIHVLELLGQTTATLVRSGKSGPAKSPDFIGLDKDWQFVLVECKATQSGSRALEKQLDSGTQQKNNVVFGSNAILREKLVAGLAIPYKSSGGRAILRIRDPDPPEEYNFGNAEPDDIAAAICQSELASILPLTGLVQTAAFMEQAPVRERNRIPGECLREIDRTLDGEGDDFVGLTRDFELPPGAMEAATGPVTRVRASIEVSRSVLGVLRGETTLTDSVLNLARRAAESAEDGLGTEAVRRTITESSDWTPRRSTLHTASGIRVTVEWQNETAPVLEEVLRAR